MNFFGTEKYFQNRPTENLLKFDDELDRQTPKDLFLSERNRNELFGQLFSKMDILELQAKMGVWIKKNKVDRVNPNDMTIALNSLNKKFLNDMNSQYSSPNTPNVFNKLFHTSEYYLKDDMESEIGNVIQDGILVNPNTSDNFNCRRSGMSDLTVSDIKNIDVYDPKYDRDIYVKTIGLIVPNSRRYHIQKYAHKRHIYGYHDGDNPDGYRSSEADRASLDNLVSGYDMSDCKKYANNSKRYPSSYQFQY